MEYFLFLGIRGFSVTGKDFKERVRRSINQRFSHFGPFFVFSSVRSLAFFYLDLIVLPQILSMENSRALRGFISLYLSFLVCTLLRHHIENICFYIFYFLTFFLPHLLTAFINEIPLPPPPNAPFRPLILFSPVRSSWPIRTSRPKCTRS